MKEQGRKKISDVPILREEGLSLGGFNIQGINTKAAKYV